MHLGPEGVGGVNQDTNLRSVQTASVLCFVRVLMTLMV